MLLTAPDAPRLTKSAFLVGQRCAQALWRRTWLPATSDDLPPEREQVLRDGDRVDRFAQTVYGGGVDVASKDLDAAHLETTAAVAAGASRIYQATAVCDWGGCRADIMDRGGGGAWTMREVKMTASVQETHLWDVAFQLAVFEAAGWEVDRAFVVHMDTQAVSPLGRDALVEVDVTDAVRARVAEIGPRVATMRSMLQEPEPDAPIGRRCLDPYPCAFRGHCWREAPEGTIHEIPGLSRRQRRSWEAAGVTTIGDVPQGARLSKSARAYVAAWSWAGDLDARTMRAWRASLMEPARIVAWTCSRSPLPSVTGVHPYELVPIACCAGAGEWVAEAGTMRDQARALARVLDGVGSVLVYGDSDSPSARYDAWGDWARRLLRRLAAVGDTSDATILSRANSRVVDVRSLIRVASGHEAGDLSLWRVRDVLVGEETARPVAGAAATEVAVARAWALSDIVDALRSRPLTG